MNLFIRLAKYLKPYKKHVAGALFSMIIYSACNIAIIPLIAKLSDAIAQKNLIHLNLVVFGAVGIYFLRGIATYGQGYLISFAAQRMLYDLRTQLFEHLHNLSLDFFTKWRTGDLIARSTNDIDQIQNGIISSVIQLLPNMLTLVGAICYLFYLNWRLSLLTLLIIPFLSVVINKFGKQMHKVSLDAQKKTADISSILEEKVAGVKIVKSFAMEKEEVKKFKKESEKSFWLSLKQVQISVTQTPLLAFIQVLGMVSIIWYGGYEVVTGKLDPSNLIAFFAGIALIADPVSKLGDINVIVQKSLASAARIFEIIDLEPTVKEKENARDINIQGRVEFKSVSFRYKEEQELVLDNISLKADKNEIIALVGRSGAGKTSFVNLIPRFYDPISGQITIDGEELKDLKLHSLRSQLGIVTQETVLFTGTIKENIAYGKVGATEDEIKQAAKIANAHNFIIELKQGYDTQVGERGVELSGGQRQRVAIARALLRNPKILIFDEATSALDTESERLVQEAMEKLMSGRTTFVIAHRLSTVQHANKILVLDKGKIVEQGKHYELLKKGGIYKMLYDMQFKEPG
ncbi:MAG: ABC transporter ATP-binding protein [Candidatus Saganbacteria bacterium]|nr:ABC transporter ATP-binding protein [Candidatus Saganbacteria bacterium]